MLREELAKIDCKPADETRNQDREDADKQRRRHIRDPRACR
jgi:hypothetical protein